MDQDKTREHIQSHADAVVRGDMATVVNDFTESLQPRVPELAQALPNPVTSAHVLSLDVSADETIALIRYSGADESVTIRSHWHSGGDHPVIVHAEPAT